MVRYLFVSVILIGTLLQPAGAAELFTPPLDAGTSGYQFRCTVCSNPTAHSFPGGDVKIVVNQFGNYTPVSKGLVTEPGTCTSVIYDSTTDKEASCYVHLNSAANKVSSVSFELVNPATGLPTVVLQPY